MTEEYKFPWKLALAGAGAIGLLLFLAKRGTAQPPSQSANELTKLNGVLLLGNGDFIERGSEASIKDGDLNTFLNIANNSGETVLNTTLTYDLVASKPHNITVTWAGQRNAFIGLEESDDNINWSSFGKTTPDVITTESFYGLSGRYLRFRWYATDTTRSCQFYEASLSYV